MPSANVTLRNLSLGGQDSKTGWFSKTFSESTIQALIITKGAQNFLTGTGLYVRADALGISADPVNDGDELKDANGSYYLVNNVREHWFLDSFQYYSYDLEKSPLHFVRPGTSGTWADTDDPRYRQKLLLDSLTNGLDPENLTEDNGSTLATFITQFDGADYPMKPVFADKTVDLIFGIKHPDSAPLLNYNHTTYGYEESVPIAIYTIDKTGITATNLLWKAECELRRVAEENYGGSLRRISGAKPTTQHFGNLILYSTEYMFNYRRSNNSVSDVSITENCGWLYDGDRVSGGIEGDWAEHENGNTGTFEVLPGTHDHLHINISSSSTPYIYYVDNATDLGLTSNLYRKSRWRFMTSASTKAKIDVVFNDGTTQTVLPETSSTTFLVGSATITPNDPDYPVVDHVRLYANGAKGDVYYDFVQIYAEDFVLPNCEELVFTPPSRNVQIPIPGRIPNITQNLGADSATVEIAANLDIYPSLLASTVNWRRPQSVGEDYKTDTDKGDVFLDIVHNQSASQPWQWLKFGNKQFKVTLDEPRFSYDGEAHRVHLTFREQSLGPKQQEYYYQRFGYI